MDIELIKCECCGLKEDCTQEYIAEVKEKFDGKWLCGLCSEAVRDEVNRSKKQYCGMDEASEGSYVFLPQNIKSNPCVSSRRRHEADAPAEVRRLVFASSSSPKEKFEVIITHVAGWR
ncbi:hypothetical protein F511_27899 [Dorcoceras hygrometricum]|uniref:DUF1677 family protein n=1 Tax=Dorcoceras hygrometricum TaxID=472368 RepID=A0A2Z7BM67_9LAMI|nr:hypothetical protein F511_27899 [Dorcoceras hygrometricum]